MQVSFLTQDEMRGGGEPAALAVGTFDGVHVGHQRLIATLVKEARRDAIPATVVTFEPHPVEVLAPEKAPGRLTTVEEKIGLLATLGVDRVVTLRFDARLAAMPARTFAEEVLAGALGARRLRVGFNFSFGAGAAGSAADLRAWAEQKGIACAVQPPVKVGGTPVSSTAIRECLARGMVGRARRMLGRPYALTGAVVAGYGRGSQLGFPTANLCWPAEKMLPAPGVYAVWVRQTQESDPFPGVANLGRRPTFGCDDLSLEVHLLAGGGDLYGCLLTVEFWRRLRSERCFREPGQLVAQVRADVERARRLLAAVYRDREVCYNRRG